jgi:polysaccharide export outer membrane protein
MRSLTSMAAALAACVLVSGCNMLSTSYRPVRPVETPAAPAPAAPAEQAEAPAMTEYPLGAGDIVKITVYNSPDLTTEAEISHNGTISFPLIGEIKIGGLSRAEAEKAIATALSKGRFVRNAHVNMLIMQYRGRQVSVIGEVNKPGKYPINQVATLTDAIATAGGIGPKAGHTVTIIRKNGSGQTEQYVVDFRKLLKGGDPERNVRIASDDIIYVPPAPVFYIYGEVRTPGAYPLTPDMTVRQALSLGGGLTPRGTERGIQVDRKGPNGEVTTRRANLTDRVQPDDVLQVPEGWF